MSQQQNNPWLTFGYEVVMFRELAQLIESSGQSLSNLPWAIQNAITESVLLHTRQLADLLLSRTSEITDIKLTTLMSGFTPSRLTDLRKAYGDNKNGICFTLNKYAMHPSTLRNEAYDYTSILRQVRPIIEDVVCEIEQRKGSKASDWVRGGKPVAILKLSGSALTHVPEILKP